MLLINILIWAIFLYIALSLLLYQLRWKLIFHPRQLNPFFANPWKEHKFAIDTQHDHLEGWFFKHPALKENPLIIYFGGNAEDITHHFETIDQFQNVSMIFISYPGYLGNRGHPSQDTIFSNALATYDYLIDKEGISPSQIIPMGRSLGASVAAYLASKRTVNGLILITPFDAIMNVAKKIALFAPFTWLLYRTFDTAKYLNNVNVPPLILIAKRDEVIPTSSTQNLIRSFNRTMTVKEIPSADHQDISTFDAFYEAINEYTAAQKNL